MIETWKHRFCHVPGFVVPIQHGFPLTCFTSVGMNSSPKANRIFSFLRFFFFFPALQLHRSGATASAVAAAAAAAGKCDGFSGRNRWWRAARDAAGRGGVDPSGPPVSTHTHRVEVTECKHFWYVWHTHTHTSVKGSCVCPTVPPWTWTWMHCVLSLTVSTTPMRNGCWSLPQSYSVSTRTCTQSAGRCCCVQPTSTASKWACGQTLYLCVCVCVFACVYWDPCVPVCVWVRSLCRRVSSRRPLSRPSCTPGRAAPPLWLTSCLWSL